MMTKPSVRKRALWIMETLILVALLATLTGCNPLAGRVSAVPSAPASRQPTPPIAEEPSEKATDEAEPAALEPAVDGRPAPDFRLKDLDGRLIRLKDLRGKRVLLVFFATWCTECRAELPEIQELYQTQDRRNLAVFAVDTLEPAVAVQRFLRINEVSFPVILDDQGAVALAYDARIIPSSAFISSAGVLIKREIGNLTVEQVDAILQDIP